MAYLYENMTSIYQNIKNLEKKILSMYPSKTYSWLWELLMEIGHQIHVCNRRTNRTFASLSLRQKLTFFQRLRIFQVETNPLWSTRFQKRTKISVTKWTKSYWNKNTKHLQSILWLFSSWRGIKNHKLFQLNRSMILLIIVRLKILTPWKKPMKSSSILKGSSIWKFTTEWTKLWDFHASKMWILLWQPLNSKVKIISLEIRICIRVINPRIKPINKDLWQCPSLWLNSVRLSN